MSAPNWVRVEHARGRCSNCGRLVTDEPTWRCYTASATYTLELCEPCVADAVAHQGPES